MKPSGATRGPAAVGASALALACREFILNFAWHIFSFSLFCRVYYAWFKEEHVGGGEIFVHAINPQDAVRAGIGVASATDCVVIILVVGIGLFSLPFGVGRYAAAAVRKVHSDAGLWPIAESVTALIVGLLILIFVPWISTGFL